jgi:hypothetical protein
VTSASAPKVAEVRFLPSRNHLFFVLKNEDRADTNPSAGNPFLQRDRAEFRVQVIPNIQDFVALDIDLHRTQLLRGRTIKTTWPRCWGRGAKAARSSPMMLHLVHCRPHILWMSIPPSVILQEGMGPFNGGASVRSQVQPESTLGRGPPR